MIVEHAQYVSMWIYSLKLIWFCNFRGVLKIKILVHLHSRTWNSSFWRDLWTEGRRESLFSSCRLSHFICYCGVGRTSCAVRFAIFVWGCARDLMAAPRHRSVWKEAWEGQGNPDLASGLCWSCWWSDQVLAMGVVVCAGYMDLTTLNFSDVCFIHTGLCPTSVKVFILLVICLFKDLCELRVKYQPDSEPLNSFFPEFL